MKKYGSITLSFSKTLKAIINNAAKNKSKKLNKKYK